ncbi:amidase [Pseudonocardia nigra]|uniref:amidase n=1 Tax=Pseudonocardia nigra TaxID=1921578 RepID=UPI001C6077CC|nr:amidase [Pseudonocardia nigra]
MTDATMPSPSDPLWRWSATRLARAIAAREISSREAVTSCLERIEQVNPVLNALVDVSADEALEAADVADRMVAQGRALGPLHGVPTSMKVNTDEAGKATTNGVVAHADAIAHADSATAANLRRAGAVLVGRSNVPAFSFRWITDNELHGRTLNPWDATRTPGGSSGGASAAVAGGMVPVAHGNDIGGSIRYPAYACGITGLRPSAGRIASSGVEGLDLPVSAYLFAVEGPLARSVDDLRLAYQGMLGHDPRDPFYAHGAAAPVSRHARRVGLLRTVGVADPTPEVDAALDQAAEALRSAGYEVDEIELPLLAEAYRLWYLLAVEEIRQIKPMLDSLGGKSLQIALEGTFACAEDWWGPAPTLADFIAGYARRNSLIVQLATFMEEYPLVLLPVSAEQAFEQDADLAGVERARRLAAAQWSQMAIPLLGFPALAVPTGVAGGLPTGVQLLGRRFDEAALFDAGAAIEARVGVFTPIDPR